MNDSFPWIKNGDGPRYIFAPFIQEGALRLLLGESDAPTTIVTRWNPGDLHAGVSDLEVFTLAQEMGWVLMLHDRLHMKVYTWGLDEALVGSANVTNKGLGLQQPSNEEMTVGPFQLELKQRLQLQRVLREAKLVTQQTYDAARKWLDAEEPPKRPSNPLDLPTVDRQFLASVLPMSGTPVTMIETLSKLGSSEESKLSADAIACALHDAANYGLEHLVEPGVKIPLDVVRDAFFDAPFIQAIDAQLNPSVQFGEIKAWIHNRCTDVPVPSRRDLTGKIQAIYAWFTELAPELYEVDVPGQRSERLTKKRPNQTAS